MNIERQKLDERCDALNEAATLAQMYCNATVTFYQCGGHKKADRNEAAMAEFKKRLEEAGETVPTLDDALKTGFFNGDGAS
jgi:hypothetical protein